MSEKQQPPDDFEEDADFIKSELTHFADFDVVLQTLNSFCGPAWKKQWAEKWEWLVMLVSKYQEQPTLLSPHLEDLISPLCQRLLALMDAFGAFSGEFDDKNYKLKTEEVGQFHALCKALQLFCKVRGYKHVVKLFPHEVSHIEACMRLLGCQDEKDFGNWETRYILMIWLCVLCIIPFDICSMDSSLSSNSTTDGTLIAGHGSAETSSRQTLVQQIVSISLSYMSDAGPTRDAASACLSTLLTRPDMESGLLREFVDSAVSILRDRAAKTDAEVKDLTSSSFQLVGILHCMSQIFKKGHRRNILPFANTILLACLVVSTQPNQTLTRKLLTKLFQRIGLTFLPPRVAAWRYQRGSRSLVENMQQSGLAVANAVMTVDDSLPAEGDIYQDDVPEEVEEVIDQLLCSLRDKDTVVRWSAAKGIGRITMRLPELFGDDVIAAVLDLFVDPDDDSAWHGGCLALAELSRRGLLLPDRLPRVFPIVSKAMHFDVLRGQHSVGAHVRDAACYVCWAFARAYSPIIIRPFVESLADAMIVVALFDREVNCRRAASAAFQENVGRQGVENFPLGIEVTAIADYFSLGIRATSFVDIAPSVAKLSNKFAATIIDHLSTRKICHWDAEIRQLAAKAIGKITIVCPTQVCSVMMEVITDGVVSTSLATRHGCVLFAAEVILALSTQGPISEEISSAVSQIVLRMDKARMYRGRGSEILREASCLLVENIARAQLPLVSKIQVALLDVLGENIKQPHENVQRAAASALRQLLHFYFAAPAGTPAFLKLQQMTVLKYMSGLKSAENVAVTRGCSLGLGVLPYHILADPPNMLDDVLDLLAKVIDPKFAIAGEPDADTRRNAVTAVGELGERFSLAVFKRGGIFSDDAEQNIWLRRADICIQILFQACNDYSVDKRGDTGSWSRTAAMQGLERLVYAFTRASVSSPLDKNIAEFSCRESVCLDTTDVRVGAHVWTSYGHGVIVELNGAGVAKIKFPRQSLGYQEFETVGGVCSMRTRKLQVIGYCPKLNSERDDAIFLPEVESRGVNCSSAVLESFLIGMIGDSSVAMFMCILLKQLGEKLDAVRGVAGCIFARLLNNSDPIVYNLADRTLLTDTLSRCLTAVSGIAMNWKQSSFVFPFLGDLLKSDVYFHSIISGFVISVGGLTEAIVKDSSKVLLKWCREQKKNENYRSLSMLSESILKLFGEYEKNDRVVLPMLKTLHLLFQNFLLDDILSNSSFGQKLYLCLKTELNKCSDMRKIRSCVDIYVFLVNSGEPLRTNSLKSMLVMLGHQFPQVRKYVAEQMYLLFIGDPFVVGPRYVLAGDTVAPPEVSEDVQETRSGFVTSQELADTVMKIFTETVWDRQLTAAREARHRIATAMGISLNIRSRTIDNGSAIGANVPDELDSYEALVREAGY